MVDMSMASAPLALALSQPATIEKEPGIYPELPMDQYHRINAASNSRLTRLHRSPAHLKAYLDEQANEDTAALFIGRAIHCAVLEPNDFENRYGVMPEGMDRRTKAGKLEYEDLCTRFGGPGFVLRHKHLEMCLRIRDAVHAHPKAGPLLQQATLREVTLVWRDPVTGVLCKARPDAIANDVADGVFIDLKSTEDARMEAFERSIFKFGYYVQGGLYMSAAKVCGIKAQHYVPIAVEKKPPFAVSVFRLTEGALDAGEQQARALLPRYDECMKSGIFPAYSEEVVDIALPSWSWSIIDEETKDQEHGS